MSTDAPGSSAVYLESLFGLRGKAALVTGASRGIGQSMAIALARAGAKVGLVARRTCQETVDFIVGEGGTAYGVRADVSNPSEVRTAYDAIVDELGEVEIVLNNAGICYHHSATQTSVDEFREVMDVNATSVFIVAREAAERMAAAGLPGRVVNMASISAQIVNVPQLQCAYNASKAAVVQLTKSLAIEYVDRGIRFNSLSPGYIATSMTTETPEAMRADWVNRVPMRRMADPSELVPALLYLFSPASTYTTGTDVVVDGGYTTI